MCLTPYPMNSFMFELVEFTTPVNEEIFGIFLKSFKRFESNIFSFLAFIDWSFWIIIWLWLLFMLLVSIIVFLILSPKHSANVKTVTNFFIKTVFMSLFTGLYEILQF